MKHIATVANSIVDLSHERFNEIESAEQLEPLGIFSHQPDEERQSNEDELFEKLKEYKKDTPVESNQEVEKPNEPEHTMLPADFVQTNTDIAEHTVNVDKQEL